MTDRIQPSDLRDLSEVSHFDAEFDVIVVGLGCAGCSAVIEACDAGAEVLALERAGGGGGTSANSGGLIYMGGGTPVQTESGFEDDPDEMYKFLCAISAPAPDLEKIRLYCDDSVEHFHWFEAQGVPFKRSYYDEPSMEAPGDDCLVYTGGEDAYPYNEIARPAPRGHKPQVDGRAGAFFMQKMLEATQRRPVRIESNTLVEGLIRSPDGRIVGVVARQPGQELCFRARRGVILAAGGFTLNKEMVARHVPMIADCMMKNAVDGDDGRGLKMARAAGGEWLHMEQAEVALPATIPKKLGKGIYVNRHGQRFINEDTYMGHIGIESVFKQEGRVYLLMDEQTFERSLTQAEPSIVAESIEELEQEAGMPTGSLVSTVALYNEGAKAGVDAQYHKRAERLVPLTNPPYALVDCSVQNHVYAAMTLGGVRTSKDGVVIDAEGRETPGLYAAGRTAALFNGWGYAASGISLGDGTYFGRRAGRAAAGESDV